MTEQRGRTNGRRNELSPAVPNSTRSSDRVSQRAVAAGRWLYIIAMVDDVQAGDDLPANLVYPPAPVLEQSVAESWLSRPRLNRYLGICSNDLEHALRLYTWNSEVAAAAFTDTCHFEVALRNAYDHELLKQYPDWAVDQSSQLFRREQGHPTAKQRQRKLNDRSRSDLESGRRGHGAQPTHGQLVASQTFGFWTKLTDKDRASLFWNPMLSKVFPAKTTRSAIHERVSRVNKFRNRLAHNEPVFSSKTGLLERLADVDEVFNLVAPSAASWARAHSRVSHLVAACPVPGLIANSPPTTATPQGTSTPGSN